MIYVQQIFLFGLCLIAEHQLDCFLSFKQTAVSDRFPIQSSWNGRHHI